MGFKLHIFESELKEIEDFVLGYTNIETGGDLFGLWKVNGDPVVQLIIGPGKKCRRTSVSFHQDTDYLARVGTYVNSTFMLCHIGSWHSHHQLSLTQPSTGDRSTVCNNFPQGLKRYIMIIANITRGASPSVVIHPYMFTQGGHACNQGEVKIISEPSPFREVGYVVECIANGAERRVTTNKTYTSMAPPAYHNRPSTNTKPIGQTMGNRRSYSPMKVGLNSQNQSKAMMHDQRFNPIYQNYVSTNDRAGHPSPMDVDPPDNVSHKYQSNWSRHHVNGDWKGPQDHMYNGSSTTHVDDEVANETDQWYMTERGGTVLKGIIDEIKPTLTRDIDYHRDTISKDLTMEFWHGGKKWMIVFPKSFDRKPASISNQNTGREVVSSKNILKDIRKSCSCAQCQVHQQNHPPPPLGPHRDSSPLRSHRFPSPLKNDASSPKRDPSPSKRDPSPSKRDPSSYKRDPSPSKQDPRHTPTKQDSRRQTNQPQSRPHTGRRAESASRPWYNTANGKATIESTTTAIEAYLRVTSNPDTVRITEKTTSKGRCKQLSFFHNCSYWTIEFVSSTEDAEVRFKKFGTVNFVSKLRFPYDVVGVLKQHCSCTKCKSTRRNQSGQQRRPRPNSRYGVNVGGRSPTRVSSSPNRDSFFSSENGERKFKRIVTDISTKFLDGGSPQMTRSVDSKEVVVSFRHNHGTWEVQFPFKFPEQSPKIRYIRLNHYSPVQSRSTDVIREIRKNCSCSYCRHYSRIH